MEKLSEDVWIEIFNLLGPIGIENAADTCENWRNIITTTPSLTRKLSLHIDYEDFRYTYFKEKPFMKLPYKNLCLENPLNYDIDEFLQEFLQDIDHLAGLEKIILKCLTFVDIIAILNKFQSITTLIAFQLADCDTRDATKIDFPNLTHIEIDTNATWLLSKIRAHKIEVFYVPFFTNFSGESEKDFGKFLQSCDKLKHFTLKGFYTNAIMKIKSQLETFEIIGVCTAIPSSFLQFLKSQKSSLKNLTLDALEFDDEIANFVYFEMQLDKIVDRRCKNGEIQKLKKVSVKNLTIASETDNFEYFEKLFQCCEMIEVLDVVLLGKNQLEFLRVLSNLSKLKYLKLNGNYKLTDELQSNYKFNRLERIILESFTTDECVSVIRCCPNLTHIKMTAILTTNDFDKIFEDCKNIQEIFLCLTNPPEMFTDEDLETFKDIGLKIKLKIETNNKEVIEKLSDAKNRLTVVSKDLSRYIDSFDVSPNILSHMYYDYSDSYWRDYFDEDDDYRGHDFYNDSDYYYSGYSS